MTMMDRRVFAGALITLPLAGRAQPATSVKRLGYVAANTPSISDRFLAAFRQGLADHGWVEGRNVVIEARYADGQPDRVAPIVAEWCGRKWTSSFQHRRPPRTRPRLPPSRFRS
jgi:putative ABC transport system substrate-binding protein